MYFEIETKGCRDIARQVKKNWRKKLHEIKPMKDNETEVQVIRKTDVNE